MNPHITAIVSHCYKLLKNIGRIRKLLSGKQTEQLVHSIITSRIDYCNVLFYGINKGVLNKLQKAENAAVRLIFRKRKRDSVTTLFHKLHWLRIEDRLIFKILLIVYKCLRGMAPLNLINLLIINFDAEYTLHTPNSIPFMEGVLDILHR